MRPEPRSRGWQWSFSRPEPPHREAWVPGSAAGPSAHARTTPSTRARALPVLPGVSARPNITPGERLRALRAAGRPGAAAPVTRALGGGGAGCARCGKVRGSGCWSNFCSGSITEDALTAPVPSLPVQQLPQRNGSAGPSRRSGGRLGSRLQTDSERGVAQGRTAVCGSECRRGFTTPGTARRGNPTAFPGREKAVNSFRPALDVCVGLSPSVARSPARLSF